MNPKLAAIDRNIFSVSELNKLTRNLIEQQFSQLWVEGEISNLSRPASGHWYFTLKDANSQVRCAMFASRNKRLRFEPQNGTQVILRGKASLYEGRGEFQLIAENLMPAGIGLLQHKFDALKQALLEEGLFDEQSKLAIPALPQHIAVITSSTGAALQDFLSVLARRFPAIQVSVIASSVQGSQAKNQLIAAITLAQQADISPPIEVLILTRGGGSLEDLWPFNEEAVARAIYSCSIPIISAVGHEVDFTIADFVADLRAPTPSAAAELVSPNQQELQTKLLKYEQWLTKNIQHYLEIKQQQLNLTSQQLQHPKQKIQNEFQRIDELEARINRAITAKINNCQTAITQITAKLSGIQPTHQIKQLQLKNQQQEQNIISLTKSSIQQLQQSLAVNSGKLNTLSPLNTINRGYSIISNENNQILRQASQSNIGDKISAQLAQGSIDCIIEKIINE